MGEISCAGSWVCTYRGTSVLFHIGLLFAVLRREKVGLCSREFWACDVDSRGYYITVISCPLSSAMLSRHCCAYPLATYVLPIKIERATRCHEHYYCPEKLPSDSSHLPDPLLAAVAVSCVDRVTPKGVRDMTPDDDARDPRFFS
jgi:hypothetical protein